MISNTSIKNQVAILIVYIHSFNKPILKTLYYVVNISITEAELFVIRCSINQAVQIDDINYIVVIIDSIHIAQRIFDSSIHLYQIYLLAISQELRKLFNKNLISSIEFWDCPNNNNWTLHSIMDKKIKNFNLVSLHPYKSS